MRKRNHERKLVVANKTVGFQKNLFRLNLWYPICQGNYQEKSKKIQKRSTNQKFDFSKIQRFLVKKLSVGAYSEKKFARPVFLVDSKNSNVKKYI